MLIYRNIFSALFLLLVSANCIAVESKLSVPLDYRLIRNVLINQLYTKENETARLWKDGRECSFLDISNPRINGDNGQIKMANIVHARIGMALGGKCLPALEWNGLLQTRQKPNLDKTGNVLNFPVTQVEAYDTTGQQLNIGQLQEIINQAVRQQLSSFKIDLNESRADIAKTLQPFMDADNSVKLRDLLSSMRFTKATAGEKSLLINISFAGLGKNKPAPLQEAPFTDEELIQWRQVWQGLENHLRNYLSQEPMANQSANDKATLQTLLQEAGAAFEQGLTTESKQGHDPIRIFFNNSWNRLGPLLRSSTDQLPGAEGLRYLTLIAATDLMYEIESITTQFGLEISANGFRKLARSYLANLMEKRESQ